MRSPFRQCAFTLIELMLAIAIAIVILAVAVPSMKGLSAERRLNETFQRFDELVHSAQLKAMADQRSWVLVWQPGRIVLQPVEPTAEERNNPDIPLVQEFTYDESESYVLERPASLLPPKDTPVEWTFWRSGACEPAIIGYTGPEGTWTAQYNPLTGRGEIIDQRGK